MSRKKWENEEAADADDLHGGHGKISMTPVIAQSVIPLSTSH